MGPRGRGHVFLAFVPSKVGRAVSSRTCPPGTDQGPPLFDWHPQIFTHSHLGTAYCAVVGMQVCSLHSSVAGRLAVYVTFHVDCPPPRRLPEYLLLFHSAQAPTGLYVLAGCEHGQGPRQDELWNRGNYREQLHAVTEVGWNGDGAKLEDLEGWLIDHSGRYMRPLGLQWAGYLALPAIS